MAEKSGDRLPPSTRKPPVGLNGRATGWITCPSGPGRRTLNLSGIPAVGPLVCYEVIFPGAVTEHGHRPAWLLNVTNDAWYGDSAGPRQHLAAARMRAVEEGLPLARAANTGISAVYDAYGHELGRLGWGIAGHLTAPIGVALPPTPFARFGTRIPIGLALLCVALGVTRAGRRLTRGSRQSL